ncbi:unnamed protein product [Nyctereutes procyonoides]|uniref:(raccoon dog) hypothetical protein n=1 Tax=Nyctereutes procyonoides TaxID=34880 RepID=A0A811YVA8_NYCPR|nr:unnamed protein product [Nyctereutes procyonoides]
MESGKMASPKSMRKDAQMMAQILKDMGITEYEPRVINQMLELLLVQTMCGWPFSVLLISLTSPPPKDFLLDIARQRNQTPLLLIKPYSGPRLPPDRYCLTAPNYRLKSLQKKTKTSTSAGRITVPQLSVSSVTSRPSTPTLGTPTPQTMSVSTKVGTLMSLTGQRFTVQMPTSQSPTVKASIPATSVQNVLINPSLIGSKNILITTKMVSSQNTSNESSNALKRKREDDDDDDDDDDDYDNL